MAGDHERAYALLRDADPEYMRRIEPTDRYRTEKMLQLYLQSGCTPTEWFTAHPPVPVIGKLPLYEIDVDRALLRERIALRTRKMVASGLIDEVAALEQKYGRAPNSMKAIGIIEVLEYFDGTTSKEGMTEAIITHTAQLAKRQQTFNRNQFDGRSLLTPERLFEEASASLA